MCYKPPLAGMETWRPGTSFPRVLRSSWSAPRIRTQALWRFFLPRLVPLAKMASNKSSPSLPTYHLKLTTYNCALRELVPSRGVQRKEDARNLTSLRARRRCPGGLEQPQEVGGSKFLRSLCPGDPRSLAEKN